MALASTAHSFPSTEDWHRLLVIAGVIAAAALVAALVDHALARRSLDPQTVTLLRVVRRTIRTTIVFVGLMSALLVIPQVRAAAGAIFASSALIGLVVGFAARTTLGNLVAGVMIAFTQPLRLGDEIEIEGERGTVEEIDLIYTFIRMRDGTRLVIPNEKLASDPIRNATIRRDQPQAEIRVKVANDQDLDQLLAELREQLAGCRDLDVHISDLSEGPVLTIRATADSAGDAERLERDLRLRAHAHLRGRGVLA